MARIPYVDDDSELAARIRAERGGQMLNLYRMLLHSPPVADGWRALATAVRQQAALDDRLRELVICQVARLTGSDYEWGQHEPLARDHGVPAAVVAALPDWRGVDGLEDRDRAVLAYVEAVTTAIEVDDETFAAVRAQLPDRELVELTVTAAFYAGIARFLAALRVDPE